MELKKRRLPPIPTAVNTALGPIKVEQLDELLDDDGKPCHDLGEADYMKRVIRLRKDLALTAKWHTLEHERVHFILWDSGVKLDHDTEERICDVVATARVADMTTRIINDT